MLPSIPQSTRPGNIRSRLVQYQCHCQHHGVSAVPLDRGVDPPCPCPIRDHAADPPHPRAPRQLPLPPRRPAPHHRQHRAPRLRRVVRPRQPSRASLQRLHRGQPGDMDLLLSVRLPHHPLHLARRHLRQHVHRRQRRAAAHGLVPEQLRVGQGRVGASGRPGGGNDGRGDQVRECEWNGDGGGFDDCSRE